MQHTCLPSGGHLLKSALRKGYLTGLKWVPRIVLGSKHSFIEVTRSPIKYRLGY